jgi:hypothetical protein
MPIIFSQFITNNNAQEVIPLDQVMGLSLLALCITVFLDNLFRIWYKRTISSNLLFEITSSLLAVIFIMTWFYFGKLLGTKTPTFFGEELELRPWPWLWAVSIAFVCFLGGVRDWIYEKNDLTPDIM